MHSEARRAPDVAGSDLALIAARRVRYVRILAALLLASSAVVFASNALLGLSGLRGLTGPALGLAGGLAGWWAILHARVRLAGIAMMIATFAWITWAAFATGGSASIATSGYLTIAGLTGWLMGRRWMFAVVCACLAAMAGLALLPAEGFPIEIPVQNPARSLVGMVVIFLVSSALLYLMVHEGEEQISALHAARRAHEQGKAQFELVAANVPAMLSHWDRELRCRWANRRYTNFFGFTPETITGRELHEVLTPAAIDAVMPGIRRVLQGEEVMYQRAIDRADGSAGTLSVHLVPDRAHDGAINGWFGLIRDVTEQVHAEQKLRESLERLQMAVDLAKLAYWEYDRSSDRIRWGSELPASRNAPALREIGGSEYLARVHPDDRARYVSDVRAAWEVAGNYASDYRILGREGATRWISVQAKAVVDASGAPVRMIGVSRDITQRKLAEAELAQSEAKFREMFDYASDAMWLVAVRPDGRLEYEMLNRAHERFTRLQTPSLIGKTPREALAAANADYVQARWEACLAAGEALTFEEELNTGTGRRTWYTSLVPIRDAGGRIYRIAGIGRDITERKRDERALRESEERFAAIFQDSPAALAVVNAGDGRFRDVNRAWSVLTGYAREQVLGRSTAEFTTQPFTYDRDDLYATLMRDGRVERGTLTFLRTDGSERICEISGHLVELGGDRMVLWGLSEVTEQRRARRQIEELNVTLENAVASRTEALTRTNSELQAALDTLRAAQEQLLRSEKMAALGRLVAGVAHELNTPIGNSLLVATTMLEQTDAFAAQVARGLKRSTMEAYLAQSREAAQMVERNLARAADLIASFKQVAADQASSQRREFHLDKVIAEVLRAHQPMLRKTAVAAEARIPAGVVMDSYPGALGQVLSNLLANAVLHAYEGRERGHVLVTAEPCDGDALRIAVRDDGRGIPQDQLQRVFDPFYTTKLGRGGTGLGLAICHNLVTQVLGGTIRIESTVAEGTALIIRLPLRAPDAPATVEAAAHGFAAHA